MEKLRLTIRRHMMPAVALTTFLATVLPAGRAGLAHLALGTTLILLYWLVEWVGIEGTFEGCEYAPSKLSRAAQGVRPFFTPPQRRRRSLQRIG
jgi:hypothetical protein